MPESLQPAPVRQPGFYELLADVAAGRVIDDEDFTPYMQLDGEQPANVSTAIWQMEREGWITQPTGTLVWHLTDAGRALLEAGAR